MNVQLQKCNTCDALKTSQAETGWVRIFGATDKPNSPHQTVIDFCPSCAVKTTADKLPAIAEEALRPKQPAK